MSTSFSRSMRSLASDHFRRWFVGLLLVVLTMGGWGYWLIFSEVTLYETSPTARLEVDRGVHPVEALVEGRVIRTGLVLGREVEAGEVLVEIDSSAQKLQLKEEQGRLESLTPVLESLRGQIKLLEVGKKTGRGETEAEVKEARARYREADAAAKLAESKLKRVEALWKEGLAPESEYQEAKALAEERRANADAILASIKLIRAGDKTSNNDRQGILERLKGEAGKLEGDIITQEARVERLQNDIEKCVIRAPVSGKLGQVSGLRVGEVVRSGDQLGAIIPEGELLAVAEFLPQSAVGKLQPGQPAQLKLDGFPWTEYGVVPASVMSVANETREGKVKVVFAIHPLPGSLIPLQHGLSGAIEVEVERVSPAALLLRTTGQRLSDASADATAATSAKETP